MNSLDGIECVVGEDFHLRQCSRLRTALLNCFNENGIEKIEIIKQDGNTWDLDKEEARSISFLILGLLSSNHKFYSGERIKLRLKKEDGSIEEDYERYSEIKDALKYK